MAKASAALKHIAETGKPLYTSLDDAQKARFQKLAWLLRPHHHWRVRYLEGSEGHGAGMTMAARCGDTIGAISARMTVGRAACTA
jgi:hypothetical protein